MDKPLEDSRSRLSCEVCGHKAERLHLTARGLVCLYCIAARLALPPGSPTDSWPPRRCSGEKEQEMREAIRSLRKKLPLEWSEDRLQKIARRMVRHSRKGTGFYVP